MAALCAVQVHALPAEGSYPPGPAASANQAPPKAGPTNVKAAIAAFKSDAVSAAHETRAAAERALQDAGRLAEKAKASGKSGAQEVHEEAASGFEKMKSWFADVYHQTSSRLHRFWDGTDGNHNP